MNETTAMLHQGRYKQAAKLKSIIKISDTMNFIITN
jgi:hypothetical protein